MANALNRSVANVVAGARVNYVDTATPCPPLLRRCSASSCKGAVAGGRGRTYVRRARASSTLVVRNGLQAFHCNAIFGSPYAFKPLLARTHAPPWGAPPLYARRMQLRMAS